MINNLLYSRTCEALFFTKYLNRQLDPYDILTVHSQMCLIEEFTLGSEDEAGKSREGILTGKVLYDVAMT